MLALQLPEEGEEVGIDGNHDEAVGEHHVSLSLRVVWWATSVFVAHHGMVLASDGRAHEDAPDHRKTGCHELVLELLRLRVPSGRLALEASPPLQDQHRDK